MRSRIIGIPMLREGSNMMNIDFITLSNQRTLLNEHRSHAHKPKVSPLNPIVVTNPKMPTIRTTWCNETMLDLKQKLENSCCKLNLALSCFFRRFRLVEDIPLSSLRKTTNLTQDL
ncbi:hypothetical protein CR513_45017, partial [Mucuna pruriens]